MNLEELGNTPKTRRDFLKFFATSLGIATGIVLLEETSSPEPAKCESGKCDCTYNTIFGEKIDGKWTKTFYGIVCKSGC